MSSDRRLTVWKRLTISVTMVAALAVSLLAVPSSAHASAYSCTGYGWIKIPRTSVASSRWCGQTNGSGRHVDSVKGAFFTVVAGVYLCETRMKVEFFNNRGESAGVYYSGITHGCWQAGGAFAIGINRTFPTTGYDRISLLSYGAEQAAVQHNIY